MECMYTFSWRNAFKSKVVNSKLGKVLLNQIASCLFLHFGEGGRKSGNQLPKPSPAFNNEFEINERSHIRTIGH